MHIGNKPDSIYGLELLYKTFILLYMAQHTPRLIALLIKKPLLTTAS
jgi:hypothetical protein